MIKAAKKVAFMHVDPTDSWASITQEGHRIGHNTLCLLFCRVGTKEGAAARVGHTIPSVSSRSLDVYIKSNEQ
jgi:hypothetical protein